MSLPTISLPESLIVQLSPLTPESFAPFGTCITSPLPGGLNVMPSTIPTPIHPSRQPNPIYANQNTALKTSPISPLTNNYPDIPSKPSSKPLMSMFSCFPRPPSSLKGGNLQIAILERHPFTTQTFSPFGLSSKDKEAVFLVIVAPSASESESETRSGIRNPPDLSNIKAFTARGDQAVTYSAGTWHAPMVVLGERRVDFLVTQFVNGVHNDDCQEVLVEGVDVNLRGLGFSRVDIMAKL